MRKIQKKKKEVNLEDFVKRSAQESDFKTLIKEPSVLMEGDEVKVIYDILDWEFSELKNSLQKIQYTVGKRSRGLNSTSRIFGFRPRNIIRNDFCSSTSLAVDYPEQHRLICSFAKKIEEKYFKYAPKDFKKHKSISKNKVKGEWLIEDSIFTSGIVNKNNPLKYHFDTGNFKKVFSAMLVFKNKTSGGHLSLPEYDVGLELLDGALLLFDGQSILHGVTPISLKGADSFRFSIVYYSLKEMWNCLTIDDELIRIRKKKTQREFERYKMPQKKKDLLSGRKGKQ